ncbi:PucR family transcriptional regulator [Amycolatopsis sp. NPDC059657]|uniref:PucR family transcriptional regulator n=1 Tax=Amycolatopsis sp. NPDC059657 TaxID=3346899 RepID=UPI00366D3882
MTLLDDRPGQVCRSSSSSLAGADVLVERMLADVAPETAKPATKVLFTEVVRIYRQVLDEGHAVVPAHRARVRTAGQAFAVSGGSADNVVDMLGRLASHLIGVVAAQRPAQVVLLVDVAHLLVRDFLAGAVGQPRTAEQTKEKRWAMVQRLVLDSEIPPEILGTLDLDYTVAVLRFTRRVPKDRLMALIEEYAVDGVLSAPAEDGAVLLVPDRAEGFLSRLSDECEARLGLSPWLATASRARAEIASGYQEAKDILALAMASGQRPGRFQLDDFLVEYAIVSDPSVCRRLVTVIEPLFAHEVLRETLEMLIRTDFNRTTAARDLFIHRSTLDYRIRRIEEITGHGPMSSRGAYVLRVAMTAYAMAGSETQV